MIKINHRKPPERKFRNGDLITSRTNNTSFCLYIGETVNNNHKIINISSVGELEIEIFYGDIYEVFKLFEGQITFQNQD